MADGEKPDVKPTADVLPTAPAKIGSTPNKDNGAPPMPVASPPTDDAPLGTMQLPRGALLPKDSGPPPMPNEAAPLQKTVVPSTASPIPNVAPPVMPQDWRYTVNVEIARGGMGRVVEATDTVLGRTVALKEALSMDTESVRRFQRETRITARLEHPAIVPVHDAGFTPSGTPYYVMRKIGGRPLEDLVARADSLNARLALVPHIVAAAHAVAHAHERGIVHRDIKPSNILVGDLGETIVIDWGLAKAMDESDDQDLHAPVQRVIENDDSIKTRAGIVFGTPGFMAPEQLRGKAVDERCDVYALGGTLYHLLARRPPHYHKNAEEMMRAAVDGPPKPLDAVVEGIPRELLTIVDKALAHDANKRYQNAGALADDLQQFLTGQIVASHVYTPRERIARFVKKNRAAVGVSLFAAVAITIVAIVMFLRIVDERDRADEAARIAVAKRKEAEEQREQVVQKARDLLLMGARHAASTGHSGSDPTRAIALVKPLVTSGMWREARDVGAAARVNGVASSIAASKQTLSLELSRDGQRALAAGNDGIVRIYDLAKGDAKIVADMKGAAYARYADGERKLVLFQGNRLTIVDVVSGDKREVTAPTAIDRLEVSGPIAYWVDPARAVWKLDLAGGPPAPVPVGEPIKMVLPSPDGRWIALGGSQHLLLIDRSSPTLPPQNITEGDTKNMTWSADSEHLVVLIDDEIIDVVMPEARIFHRIIAGNRFSVAYSAGRIFSAGPTGVGIVSKDGTRIRSPGHEHTLGVFEGRERVVISAKPQGAIVVMSDWGDHTLACPMPITSVAASARGPWIVAAAEDRLLVWNIDAIEPRLVTQRQPSSARFVTGDYVIATYEGEPAEWIDLKKNKTTQLGDLEAIVSVVAAPDGAAAVAIDLNRRAWLVTGIGQPQELQGEISAATFVDEKQLVLAGNGGVRLEDQQRGTKLVLYAHESPAKALVSSQKEGGWVAASFDDGVLWRKNLRAGTSQEMKLPAPSNRIAITPDGRVLFGIGGELRVWKPDGNVDVLAKDLKPIVAVALADAGRALALADDGNLYIVDYRSNGPLQVPISVSRAAALSIDNALVASPTAVGGVEVVDPLVRWRWSLATPTKGQAPYTFVEIAPDGSRVMAMNSSALLVWTLDLPSTAESTATWLGHLTNATADSPAGPLGWQ